MANTRPDRPTHIEVDHPEPGDGETISVREARQGNPGRRVLMVLLISLTAAVVALGAYWAINAPRLRSADIASGVDRGQATSTVAPPAPAGPGPSPG